MQMTKDEAVRILTDLKGYDGRLALIESDRIEALEMAIKALERGVNLEKDNTYRKKKWGSESE